MARSVNGPGLVALERRRDGIWTIDRTPEMTDMEWQLRNWGCFTWLDGDHIVEQHLHNLDSMRWVIRQPPVKRWCLVGGRCGSIN
jgi:hypothetical protein